MTMNTGVLEAQTLRMPTSSIPQPQAHGKAAPRRETRQHPKKAETRGSSDVKNLSGVSIFGVLGTILVSVLMVFVVLAQISYTETANETVRLSAQIAEMTERHRALEFAFESSLDIKEIERIAKDELGMSRPDAAQVLAIAAVPRDTATVIAGTDEISIHGFAQFIQSLTEYFTR